MVEPRLKDLLTKVDSKYALVILSARRARQINDYFVSLRRPDILKGRAPLIETDSDKPLTISLEEIMAGEVFAEAADDATIREDDINHNHLEAQAERTDKAAAGLDIQEETAMENASEKPEAAVDKEMPAEDEPASSESENSSETGAEGEEAAE